MEEVNGILLWEESPMLFWAAAFVIVFYILYRILVKRGGRDRE